MKGLHRLVLLITLLPAGGSAADYYIDPIGGNDALNDGLSPTDTGTSGPWRSFANVFAYYQPEWRPYPNRWVSLQPGDTLYLMDGTFSETYYNGTATQAGPPPGYEVDYVHTTPHPDDLEYKAVALLTASGTAGNPIRIRPYPGAHPVIDTQWDGEGIRIWEAEWWEISGFTIRYTSGQGGLALRDSAHVKVYGMTIHDHNGWCGDNMGGLHSEWTYDVEIYDSVFYDNYDRNEEHWNSNNISLFGDGNISVHDCLIYQTSDPVSDPSGTGVRYKMGSPNPASTFQVYNNLFVNNSYVAVYPATANTHVHHNLVIGGGHGIYNGPDSGGFNHQTNQVFEYNTLYMTAGNPYSGAAYDYPTANTDFPNDPEGIVFRHNIAYDVRYEHNQEWGIAEISTYQTNEQLATIAAATSFSHNCYFSPTVIPLRFNMGAGLPGALRGSFTFAEWQSVYGYDVSGTVIADPEFTAILTPEAFLAMAPEDRNALRFDPDGPLFRPGNPAVATLAGAYAGGGLRVGDATISEDNAGATTATFEVSLVQE